MEFFNDLNRHDNVRKQLVRDRLFDRQNVFFVDQFFTFNIYTHKRAFPVQGDTGNLHKLQQSVQAVVQIQNRENFKKWF